MDFLRNTNRTVAELRGKVVRSETLCHHLGAGVPQNRTLANEFIPSRNHYRAMRTLLLTLSVSSLFCLLIPSKLLAQQSSQYEEVVFGFTLKELGSYNISVAVKDDRIYLPVMELFNIFEVYYTIEGQNVIRGTYLSSEFPMKINPVKRLITLGDKRYELTKEDIFKGEMDIDPVERKI